MGGFGIRIDLRVCDYEVGALRERDPHLLAVNDVLVAISFGPRQLCVGRSCIWLADDEPPSLVPQRPAFVREKVVSKLATKQR